MENILKEIIREAEKIGRLQGTRTITHDEAVELGQKLLANGQTKVKNLVKPDVSGQLPTDVEIEDAWSKMINISKSVGFVNGAKWMRDKIKVGNFR